MAGACLLGLAAQVAACSTDDPATPILDAATDPPSAADAGADAVLADAPTVDAPGQDAGFGVGPFAIVFASPGLGIDLRTATTTFDGSQLLAYAAVGGGESLALGTASVSDVGDAAGLVWGRWRAGQPVGMFPGVPTLPSYGADSGFHYAVGEATKPLPGGATLAFAQVGSTPPTIGDGSLSGGTVVASAATSGMGASARVGISISVTMPSDTTYVIGTTGGTSDPSMSELSVDSDGLVSATAGLPVSAPGSAACGASTCTGVVYGFFAGVAARHLALGYVISADEPKSDKGVAGIVSLSRP